MMLISSLGLLFVASIARVEANLPKDTTPTALATVTPCPPLSAWDGHAPITVTSQYQPVSTCVRLPDRCVNNRCWPHYSYSTHDFVSTVIPCPFASPSSVTVTKTEQSILVSRSSKTVTNTYVTSTVTTKWKWPFTVTTTASAYTTFIKKWSAAYKDLGPLALPEYGGSGICTQCQGPNGRKMQPLDVIECIQSSNRPKACRGYPEVWVFAQVPSSALTASAVCSTHTSVSAAGIYVFEFPQHAPPATIEVPPQTATYPVRASGGRTYTSTSIATATTTVFPGRHWTATVTRNCPRPTVISFEITITKVLDYVIPPLVFPNGP